MNRYLATLLLIFITAVPHRAKAFDDNDLAYVEFTQQPSSEFQERDAVGVSMKVRELKAGIQVPLVFSLCGGYETIIINSVKYEMYRFDVRDKSETARDAKEIESLHGISYQLGLNAPISKDFSVHLYTNVGIYSDMDDVSKLEKEDTRNMGGVMLIKKHGWATWTIGIINTNDFGEPVTTPICGVSGQPVNWFRFNILIPSNVDFSLVSDRFEVGLFAKVEGNQFRLTRNNRYDDYIVNYSVIKSGLSARLRTFSRIYIYMEAGTTALSREFEMMDNNSNSLWKGELEDDLSDSWFFTCGTSFRV